VSGGVPAACRRGHDALRGGRFAGFLYGKGINRAPD
jgi:hypothetical protein